MLCLPDLWERRWLPFENLLVNGGTGQQPDLYQETRAGFWGCEHNRLHNLSTVPTEMSGLYTGLDQAPLFQHNQLLQQTHFQKKGHVNAGEQRGKSEWRLFKVHGLLCGIGWKCWLKMNEVKNHANYFSFSSGPRLPTQSTHQQNKSLLCWCSVTYLKLPV